MKFLKLALLGLAVLAGCSKNSGGTTGGNPLTEDTSASGAVAQAVGGALSSSSATGLQASFRMPQHPEKPSFHLDFDFLPRAHASGFCPTFLTTTTGKCDTSGSSMYLDYVDCSFNSSNVNWHGKEALTVSTGTPTCGSFPNPGAGGTLYRQYVERLSPTTPSTMLITSTYGTLAGIDHASSNLHNFDGATIATVVNGGYGLRVDFNGSGGTRSDLTLAERVLVGGVYDHSITGHLTVVENTSSSRTVTGTLTVYLNGAQVIGTAQFNNVTHTDMCCQPTGGDITTTFAAGTATPTTIGALMVGKSEKLTFSANCGVATLQKYDGTVENVLLSRCF